MSFAHFYNEIFLVYSYSPDDGPALPTKSSEEFKPFMRRLPEFKFWWEKFSVSIYKSVKLLHLEHGVLINNLIMTFDHVQAPFLGALPFSTPE